MNIVLNVYWSILYYQHIQAQLISNVNSVPNLSSLFSKLLELGALTHI